MPKEDVARHYNQRKQQSHEERQQSPIVRLKNFNNFLKATLINEFVRSGDRVLDLCCGKGGDLKKFSLRNIKYWVGVDVSSVGVRDAEQRYKDSRNSPGFEARFHAYDCFSTRLKDVIPKDLERPFDIVSCQFALHYAFETEAKLRGLLRNVSENLAEGGTFIGTTTDANRLVKKLKMSDNLQFGNKIYNARFEEKYTFSVFGHRFWFTLEDAIDDCAEYLVHFPTLVKIAEEYGLKLLFKLGFHEFYAQRIDDRGTYTTAQRMRVCDESGHFPAEDWEVIGLYCAFAFRKARGSQTLPPNN